MRTMDLADMFARVYGAADIQELKSVYDEWAFDYDGDLVEKLGWIAPMEAVAFLEGHLSARDAPVLDIGAGTGLVGQALKDRGFAQIEALDLSPHMLKICRSKNIYKKLHQAELGRPLPLPSDYYAAVVGIGVFTEGHATAACFDEITRIVRPGGHFGFAITTHVREHCGFAEAQEQFVREGRWQLVEHRDDMTGFRDLETAPYELWIYQVCK